MNTITGLLIDTTGQLRTVQVQNRGGSHLASMYEHIGCRTVDVATAPTQYGPVDVWVDDEGAYTSTENVLVSMLLRGFTGQGYRLFGNALLLSNAGEDTIGLTADQIEYLTAIHALTVKLPTVIEELTRAHVEAAIAGRP